MVPLKLGVKNFLSYGEDTSVLDFRDFKIACLSGRNGHGKSALVDALTWALWGRCRVKNKEEVIKRGASGAQVELEFESEGITYRILRSITKKKGGSQGSLDLQVFDESAGSFKPHGQGVKAQDTIGKILKMDYNSFICSSFILQGMADEFTKRTPAERKEVLSKILELDEYETLTKRARDHAQSASASVTALEAEAGRMESEIATKEEHEKKLAQLRLEEESVSGSIAGFEKIRAGLIGEFESVKAKLDTLSRLGKEREDSVSAREKIEKELRGLRESIGKDREIVSREAEILKAFAEYEAAREKDTALNEKRLVKSNLEKEIERLRGLIEREKAKLEQKAGALEARIGENRKTIRGTEEIIARQKDIESGYEKLAKALELEASMNEKKSEALAIENQGAEIERKIGQKRAGLEMQSKELSAKIKDLESRASLSGSLSREIAKLKASIGECGVLSRKAESLREELKRAEGEKQAALARQSELGKRKAEEEEKLHVLTAGDAGKHCPLCESPLGEEARAALVEKLRAVINELGKNITRTANEINELGTKEKKLREGLVPADSVTGKLPGLHKELGEKEQSLSESESASIALAETKKLFDAVSESIKLESYRKEFDAELGEILKKRAALGYDGARHDGLREEIESLRKYGTERELLKKETTRKQEAEAEIGNAEKELVPLREMLIEGRYGEEWRAKIKELDSELEGLGYDPRGHEEVRETLKRLERSAREKETLERARLSLGLREAEEKKLSARADEEKEKLANIEAGIEGLGGIESLAREIEEKMSAAGERVASLNRRKEELMMDISRSVSALERIGQLALRKEEIGAGIKESKNELTVFQELAKAFGKNGLQALIIEHAVPEIEAEANKILGKLTEGTMTLSLEMVRPTQKGGEKETLEIYIGDSSGTRSYETFSGGEAFRIDFALRVGISKFIANRSGAQLRTLVIDEGFGTQDREGLNQFVQVINSIKGDFDKILAITHVDELKERFPVRIEVTKEPGEGSKFEVVYT